MNFDGKVRFILDLRLTPDFISLRECVLKFKWEDHTNLFNIDDPAFKDSGVIQFNFDELMRHIRQPDVYVTDVTNLIDAAMPVIEQIKFKFPGYKVLKSHFVAIMPGGRQMRHIDNIFYHTWCKRLVVPITGNDGCLSFIGNQKFNLSIGQLYEINNKLLHHSENLGESFRTYMFVDMYNEESAHILNKHYGYGSVV